MPKESLIIGYAEATPSIEIDSGEVYPINAEVANRFFTAGSSPSRIASVPGNATECGVSKLGGKSEVVSGSLVSADVSAVESLKSDNTTLDSLTIPSSLRTDHPLRSAGSVHDEYDFERMVMVQRVGSVDLGSLTWSYMTTLGTRFETQLPEIVGSTTNAVCGIYSTVSFTTFSNDQPNMAMAIYNYTMKHIDVRNTSYTDAAAFKTAMSGVMLYYELATPVEVDISSYFPAEDFVVDTEPGGTVQFTQTQSPALSIPNEITFSETY